MAEGTPPPVITVVNQPAAPPGPVTTVPVKSGVRTTEFLLVAVTNLVILVPALLEAIPDIVPKEYVGMSVALLNGLYAIGRAYVKAHAVGEETRIVPPHS